MEGLSRRLPARSSRSRVRIHGLSLRVSKIILPQMGGTGREHRAVLVFSRRCLRSACAMHAPRLAIVIPGQGPVELNKAQRLAPGWTPGA